MKKIKKNIIYNNMKRVKKNIFYTNETIRKNPGGPGYLTRQNSQPYCYVCCRHGCLSVEKAFKLKGKKSLKKIDDYHRGAKWSYKNKLI